MFMHHKRPQIAKVTQRKNKAEGMTLPHFKIHFKTNSKQDSMILA